MFSPPEDDGTGAEHGGVWMKSIDAKTLDQLITEMNEMNRWFAKVCNNITVKILASHFSRLSNTGTNFQMAEMEVKF